MAMEFPCVILLLHTCRNPSTLKIASWVIWASSCATESKSRCVYRFADLPLVADGFRAVTPLDLLTGSVKFTMH